MSKALIFASLLALSSVPALAGKNIPVHFIILQESSGQGNEVWARDNKHIDAVLRKLNTDFYSQSPGTLVLGVKKVKKDSRLYNSPMSDGGKNSLIEIFQKDSNNYDLEDEGAILVVIARELKVDVSGRAERQGTDYSPTFIMRSVRNNPDPKAKDYVGGAAAIQTDAGLFSHEMGHLMDLRHRDNTKTSYNTENYTKDPQGIAIYKRYFQKMVGKNPKYGGGSSGGGSGGGGGGGGRGIDVHINLH